MELLAAGGLPIDDEHPKTTTHKMLQKAALGQEIEDLVSVNQRGHDQHRRCRAVGAVIEQLCRAVVHTIGGEALWRR
jgi:hypothetical protein